MPSPTTTSPATPAVTSRTAARRRWYPAIYRAIAATGYDGSVGMEFVPRGDPLVSLRAALEDFQAASEP